MPSIITHKAKISNAKNFVDRVANEDSILYVFLGKPIEWPEETRPPVPKDTQENTARIWDEVLGLKKIPGTDVKHVVKRIDWKENEIYDAYDDLDTALFSKRFYVMNSTYDVYKCISNNFGAYSVKEPTGKSLNIFTTSDGYRWKYLYSVTAADQLKFLTRNWMPVVVDPVISETALTKDGAIEHIIIYNGGTDYSASASIEIIGDGVSAEIIPKNRVGVVYDVEYQNVGSGYRYAKAVVTDSSGNYANLRPIVSPVNGHGNDPITELNAHYIMLSARTEYNEGFGDIPPNVTFRRIGIVENPQKQNGDLANDLTMSGYYTVRLTNTAGEFVADEYVIGQTSGANIRIITATNDTVGNYANLRYMQADGVTSNFTSPSIEESVYGVTSGAVGYVANIILPEVKHDSGDIIYLENRTKITRSLDQAEFLHLVIEF